MAVVLGALAALAAAALAGTGGDRREEAGAAPAGPLRGCQERVEGDPLRPRAGRDTIVGPIAFVDLPAGYRYSREHPGTGIKSVALVDPGARVTLVVPRDMRPGLRVLYTGPRHAARLQACRHAGSPKAQRRECGWKPMTACRDDRTYFSGGFEVDFDRAPERGRCAAIVAWVDGRRRPLRRHLFDPPPSACGRGDPEPER